MRFLTKLGIFLVLLSLGLNYFTDSSLTLKDIIENPLEGGGLLGLTIFLSMFVGGVILVIMFFFGRKRQTSFQHS